jgi:hypothetical protein
MAAAAWVASNATRTAGMNGRERRPPIFARIRPPKGRYGWDRPASQKKPAMATIPNAFEIRKSWVWGIGSVQKIHG